MNRERLRDNLDQARQTIADAARRSGRSPDEVALVGVTKYASVEATCALFEAGLADLGESRPQELWRKAEALADGGVRWHLIGHLQRNKVNRTLPLVHTMHSGDSLRILQAVDAALAGATQRQRVLIEVNISGDAAKHGFAPGEVEAALEPIASLARLQVVGLMAMASLEGGREQARRDFAALRELRDRLAAACPPQVGLSELSMGMSDDYDIAIEEGATLVRIGSALFEGVEE